MLDLGHSALFAIHTLLRLSLKRNTSWIDAVHGLFPLMQEYIKQVSHL